MKASIELSTGYLRFELEWELARQSWNGISILKGLDKLHSGADRKGAGGWRVGHRLAEGDEVKLATIELTDTGAVWVGDGVIAVFSRHYIKLCKPPLPANFGQPFELLGLRLCIVDMQTAPPWLTYVARAGFRGRYIATRCRLKKVWQVVLLNLCLILEIWGFMEWPVGVIPGWKHLKWPWRTRRKDDE
jgi:hypothetical protein